MNGLKTGQWHQYLCCVLAFVIPLPFIAASVSIIVLSAAWIGSFRPERLKVIRSSPQLLLWILFYALHAVSYFYSDNHVLSAKDLETKMSFVLLPLLIGAGPAISADWLRNIFLAFICGVCVAAVFSISQGAVWFHQDGNPGHLLYHDLVRGLSANAVYMSLYVIAALIFLLFGESLFTGGTLRYLRGPVLLLLLIFLLMLSCRSLLVLFFLVIVPAALVRLYRKKRLPRKLFVVTAGAVAGLILLVALTRNPLKDRFTDIARQGVHESFLPDYRHHPQDFTNLTFRLFIWRVGLDNIKRHRLWLAGCGNGDVTTLLNARMDELGIRNIYSETNPSNYKNVNLHNMYLETLMMLGAIGLSVLLILVLSPLFLKSNFEQSSALLLVLGTTALFMMQEAAFQTQAGVIFYLFFYCIFFNRRKAVKELEIGLANT